jgi:DNA-binding transcriptional MerR regulator
MTDETKTLFTIGEFADLFGVSKQTLFYYEKNQIFVPRFVKANGYRYYSLDQYFVFEIIITLRKTGLSLKKIKEYVDNRSIGSLQNLLANKALEYDLQIELLQRNRKSLLILLDNLQLAATVTKCRITLEECGAEYFIATPFIADNSAIKNQIHQIASHNLPFAKSELLSEHFMGYIVPRENLLPTSLRTITQIFTRLSHPDEYSGVQQKPAGLYAKIITPDGYHTGYPAAIEKLLEFIHRNSLTISGNAYIQQLKNYWATQNPQEYVTQIAIPVDEH